MLKFLAGALVVASASACLPSDEAVRFEGSDFHATPGSDLKPAPRMVRRDWVFGVDSGTLTLDLSALAGCHIEAARVMSASPNWQAPLGFEIWSYETPQKLAAFAASGPRGGGESRTAHRLDVTVPDGEVYLFAKGAESQQLHWVEFATSCP